MCVCVENQHLVHKRMAMKRNRKKCEVSSSGFMECVYVNLVMW